MYERILIPIDGSPCTDAVVHEGLALARTHDAGVTFLYVVEDSLIEIYGVTYGKQLYEALLKAGDETLDRALRRAQAANLPAKTLLVDKEHPAEAILAAEADYDLTVMGTHGRRGLRQMMMGSVTQEVLRRSTHPHLVVRCPEERGES